MNETELAIGVLNLCNDPMKLIGFARSGQHFDTIETPVNQSSIEGLIELYRTHLRKALEAAAKLDKEGIERPWVKILDTDGKPHGRMRLEIR